MTAESAPADDRMQRREVILSVVPRQRKHARAAVLRSTLVVVYARALRGPIEPAR